ncbi:MAG TPA: hypothetical protein VLW54_01105 [Candidatus Acidoferrales bacterium]|nr:hypothetical protein [Candidatus Acidoferrales bacterium]
MKLPAAAALILFAISLSAQAPLSSGPVALKAEPHFRLVFENDYVRAWLFDLPGGEATLPHAHEVPYLTIALMPGDYVDAEAGKPEQHLTPDDGELGYSAGGGVHVLRTDSGTRFQGLVIELLRPQGGARNRCEKVIDAPLDCPVEAAGRPVVETPVFETQEILVQAGALPQGRFYNAESSPAPRLFAVLSDSEISVEVRGEKTRKLRGGELYWLAPELGAVVTDIRKESKKGRDDREELKLSRFYVVSFKDGGTTRP